MLNDPERQLRRYINIRSEHLFKVAALGFVATSAIAFLLFWDSKSLGPLAVHLSYLSKIMDGSRSIEQYLNALEMRKLVLPIVQHITFSLSFGLIGAVASIIPWIRRPDRMSWIYIKDGVEVFEQARAGIKAFRKKVGIWKKRGIKIYQGVGGNFRLPYEFESKHLLYLGSVGSGKTASMLHAIQSIIKRGDKAVVYDYKGDMTEWLLGRDEVSLIGFADKRSEAWHIAKDIHDPLLARELAKTIIKETSEPVWSDSARDVLSGVIEYLITTKPGSWGFQDVSDLLNQDRQEMAKLLRSIGHGAANTIDKPNEDRGANSIMTTVRSGAWIFDVLGKAWGNPSSGFSVRDWIHDKSPDNRIVILRNYPGLSAVSNWLLYIIFNQLFGEVLSLKDDGKRRIWAVIDELATLPSIPRLEECLIASRSRGFRFMCGIQNFSSMREKYGADIAQTIFSQFATRIICRVSDADTASALAADMGGDRRIIRADVRLIKSLDDKGREKMEWDTQWVEKIEPTMLNSSIMNLPDPTEKGGVPAWLYISSFPIAKLQWHFLKIKPTASVDEPVDWMNEVEPPQAPEEKIFKPKPFPTRGKLAKPLEDDFEDLDGVDTPELDGDE
ncbi:Type IV secretory pathway, VirD4 component, TraG/TraD family ATPase [Mariprofundus aestuarium]|uniref:Type IV secretory pathway, VirD4 component, TraG/TraD family ATPase n=2 Tax=Mariprofundus aestuarium TaxID=1921086 RepID=A0A2K8KYW2_MARES|nr:Type IV secretory pathway, VirD4 component, TraG/TraD family ATPase [Mariprofundus aestuarium]